MLFKWKHEGNKCHSRSFTQYSTSVAKCIDEKRFWNSIDKKTQELREVELKMDLRIKEAAVGFLQDSDLHF